MAPLKPLLLADGLSEESKEICSRYYYARPVGDDIKTLTYYMRRENPVREYLTPPYQDEEFKRDLINFWPLDPYVQDLNLLREDDKFSVEFFESLWAQVDKSKSPGSPFKLLGFNANSSLEVQLGSLNCDFNNRFNALVDLGSQLYSVFKTNKNIFNRMFAFREDDSHKEISQMLAFKGYVDPVLLNVKSEPRKNGKEKRLVCMISVLDNLIDRALCGHHLKEEQLRKDITTAVALDLTTPEKTNELHALFTSHSPLLSSDVRGWEYSCRSELTFRSLMKYSYQQGLSDEHLNVFPGKEMHFYALLARFFCIVHRVLQTKCGDLFVTPPGMVSSGLLLTYSKNSFERASLSRDLARHVNFPAPFIRAAGDDEVSNIDAPEDVVKRFYARFGFVITDYMEQSDSFSFCSTTFIHDGTYQDNIERSFVNVLYTAKSAEHFIEQMAGFEQAFKRHPQYAMYRALLDQDAPSQWQ